jgi:NTE family protein
MFTSPFYETHSMSSIPLNFALQGGGSHGAFTWGALDWLLEHHALNIAAISGTSAGAMNATVLANGWLSGSKKAAQENARAALEKFWRAVSQAGMMGKSGLLDNPFVAFWMDSLTRTLSPYQLNPGNLNPLRSILEEQIDFARLRSASAFSLMIAATRVRDGRVKIFREAQLTSEMVLASACLPTLFQAIHIDGNDYWDGGYTADPALWPLFYDSRALDTVLIMVNPLTRKELPRSSEDIVDRLNEISFNASLLAELRAVAFAQRLHQEQWLKPEHVHRMRNPRIHILLADDALKEFSVSSKMRTDWEFLIDLKERGRAYAAAWWKIAGPCVGLQSSVDLRQLL